MKVSIPGSATATDDERRFAGLPTSTELAQDALNRRKIELANKQIRGEPISDVEAVAAGLTPAWQIDAAKREQIDPLTQGAATRHVAGVLNSIGRIPANGVTRIGQQAFERWMAERQRQKIGALTPDETSYAQSFFEAAARDAFAAQQEADNARMNAETGRLNATRPRSGEGLNIPQMTNALSRMAEGQLKSAQEIAGGTLMQLYVNMEESKVPPTFQPRVREYKAAMARVNEIRQAQSMFAAGHITPEQAQAILDGASLSDATRSAPAPGGAAPAPNRQAATSGIDLRGGADTTTRAGGVPTMSDQQLNMAASQMRQMPKDQRAAYIDSAVQAGTLSAEDARRLKAKVGA